MCFPLGTGLDHGGIINHTGIHRCKKGAGSKGPFLSCHIFPLNPFPWEELCMVRAAKVFPASSSHILCCADPLQLVVSSLYVPYWKHIRQSSVLQLTALPLGMWLRCFSAREQKVCVVCSAEHGSWVPDFWCMPIAPFLFSGWPQVCKQAWNKKITCLTGKVFIHFMSSRVAKDVVGQGTWKVGIDTKTSPGSDMSVWRGELSALSSSLTGEIMVCKQDHVGPLLCNVVWEPRKVSTWEVHVRERSCGKEQDRSTWVQYPLWRVWSKSWEPFSQLYGLHCTVHDH